MFVKLVKEINMLTFKQFFESIEEYIFEQKYSVDAADALSVAKDPKSHPVSRIWAGRHLTKENGHTDEDIGHHIRDMASGDTFMKIAAILHPHAEEHLTPDQIEAFKTHRNKKISAAAQKRWSSDSSQAPAKAAAPKIQKQPATPKPAEKAGTVPAVKGKIYKLRSMAVTPKEETPEVKKKQVDQAPEKKPAATKSSAISVVQGNPEDHGLPPSAKISHVMKNGKSVATAISNVRPGFGELDKDETVHQAFVGDHTKEGGLKHVSNHSSHQEALIAAAKAHGAKKS